MSRFLPGRLRPRGLGKATAINVAVENGLRDTRQLPTLDNPSGRQNPGIEEPGRPQAKEKPNQKPDKAKKLPKSKRWRPVALRRTSMAAFILVFCSILAALETMNQYSARHQGLVSTIQSRHYLWTYGPTAVFTLLAALWQRTEYRAAQIAPWLNMSRRKTAASRSVLLDYVSGFQPSVIGASLRNGDYTVAAASTCSLAITLMIIISTGLLGLEQQALQTDNYPLMTTTTFNGVRSNLDAISSSPIYISRGLQALQLPYPPGTTPRYSVQSFKSLKDTEAGSQLTADVDGMLVGIDCEIADIDLHNWNYSDVPVLPPPPNPSATINSSTCQFDVMFQTSVPQYGVGFVTMATDSYCDDNKDGLKRVFLLYATTLTIKTEVDGVAYTNESMVQSAQLICKPYYDFSKVTVTIDTTSNTGQNIINISPLPGSMSIVMSNISADDISTSFLTDLLNAGITDLADDLDPYDCLAFWLTTLQYPEKEASDFLNASLLKDAFESLYSQIATQIVREQLIGTAEENTTGTIRTKVQRLVVRTLSLRLLEGLLCLVVLIGTCMIFILPAKPVLPRDPGSILGTTVLLWRSQHTMQTFRGTGRLSLDAIESRVFCIEYSTSLDMIDGTSHFQTIARVPSYHKLDSVLIKPAVQDWWQPFMTGKWALSLCLLIQIGIIVALEVTFRLSQKHSGLADVSNGGYLPYTWTFLPAFVLSYLALAYTSIGFHAKVFTPFSALRSNSNATKALLVNYLDRAEIHCLWTAAHFREFALLSITLAVILGGFLTIAVSGVFVVQQIPAQLQVSVSIAGWFDTNGDSGSSINSVVATTLVVDDSLSYPAWTYGEFVFPYIQINHQSVEDASRTHLKNATSLRMIVPALRSKMDCDYKADKKLNVTLFQGATCTNYLNCGNSSVVDYTNNFIHWNDSGNPSCPVDLGAGIGTFGWVYSQVIGCPPIYTWGSTGNQTINHVAAMTCDNIMEQLDVNVTFSLPGFIVDPSNPPIGDESTAKFFANANIYSYGTLGDPLPGVDNGIVDRFFDTLTRGRDGFPIADLASTKFDDKVVAGIKHLNALIRAQDYNTLGRIPATGAIAARKLTGTATDPDRTRLVQTQVSTRIVQGLLGVMAVLALISHFAMDTRKLLPKNPCSIAGMASLMAHSEFLKDDAMLNLAGWRGDRELRKRRVFERQVFGLGWFDAVGVRHAMENEADPRTTVNSGNGERHSIPRKPLPVARRRFGVDIVRAEQEEEAVVGLTARGTMDGERAVHEERTVDGERAIDDEERTMEGERPIDGERTMDGDRTIDGERAIDVERPVDGQTIVDGQRT